MTLTFGGDEEHASTTPMILTQVMRSSKPLRGILLDLVTGEAPMRQSVDNSPQLPSLGEALAPIGSFFRGDKWHIYTWKDTQD